MTTRHPLWRAFDPPTPEELDNAWVSGARPRTVDGRIEVVPADPSWPEHYAELAGVVRAALRSRVVALEHVGSTSVAGLAAKPVIDLDLVVADSADEQAYVPDLEAAGFDLIVREPDWEQHRCFSYSRRRCNLHVFSPDATEPARHILFRDWLRANEADRVAYGALKTQLATQRFDSVVNYNNAKAGLIYDIYERAFAADPRHPHDPHPRT